MKYQKLRGMREIYGDEAKLISHILEASSHIAQNYNYSEVILPTIEEAELFTRTAGETTDIVEKQMYVFKDKGDRTVALRPEGTAGAARYYIQTAAPQTIQKGIPFVKIFYKGSMFRYERPQAGRYREFIQWGAEYFGNSHPCADVEIISLLDNILEKVGLKDRVIYINSLGCSECRPRYIEELKKFISTIQDSLCYDCKRRLTSNPLRILDCKIDSPRIFTLKDFPKPTEYLCTNCSNNYTEVKKLLNLIGLKYTEDHLLVRGLDYYTRTVFEVKSISNAAAQDAVAAGGRYDNLIQQMGGKPTPAAGFAIGVERLASAIINNQPDYTKRNFLLSDGKQPTRYFIVITSDNLLPDAIKLSHNLRTKKGLFVEGPISGKSIKNQLALASRFNFEKTLILADEEFKERQEILIKDMSTGEQKAIKLSDLDSVIS